jgi:hypothetical protein
MYLLENIIGVIGSTLNKVSASLRAFASKDMFLFLDEISSSIIILFIVSISLSLNQASLKN